jgi:P pilus assembly chaperone PapD
MQRSLLVLALMLVPVTAAAQGVVIAPHAIHIDARTRSGTLELYNPGNDPVEIEISTLFGYPVTDSTGRITMLIEADPDSTAHSAADWITAFPRRMTVEPRARQTVRLLARPPAGLEDGEYWTRLVVAARGGAMPVSGADSAEGISVGLTLQVRTIIAVTYRNGLVTTGISSTNLRANQEADTLVVRTDLAREGNGAFIGTLRSSLVDSTGATLVQDELLIAVYHQMSPRRVLPLDDVGPGSYRLIVELTSERSDVPPDVVLPIVPVADTVVVQLR